MAASAEKTEVGQGRKRHRPAGEALHTYEGTETFQILIDCRKITGTFA
jgi:hypothetical protein